MAEEKQEFLTAPIDDYLLSIADSLQQVQQRLNQNRVLSTDGQSATVYQIPRLDFELKMSMEIEQQTTEDGQTRPVLKGAPVSNLTSTKRQIAEAASTIKGAFVAVPSEGGAPPPIVKTKLQKKGAKEYEVTVYVQSAIGQDLEGVQVEFNVSKKLSKAWSEANLSWFAFKPASATAFLGSGKIIDIELTAEGNGYNPATTEVAFSGGEGSGASARVSVDSEGKITNIKLIGAGSGYTSAPTLTITDGGQNPGTGAAAIPIIEAADQVARIEIDDPGQGYARVPTIELTKAEEDTTGSGAEATASIDVQNEVISKIEVSNGGSGYESAPKIKITPQPITQVNAFFNSAIEITDEQGIAKSNLLLDPNSLFPEGTPIVAVIDVLGKTETIVFRQ